MINTIQLNKTVFIFISLIFFISGIAFSQSDDEGGDFDSMFEESVVEGENDETDSQSSEGTDNTEKQESTDTSTDTMKDPLDSLLTTEGIEWGGKISNRYAGNWSWMDGYPDSWNSFIEPDSRTFIPDLSGTLFFNARPNSDFRAYGKFKTSYPFKQGSIEDGKPIEVFELFSDFNWNETLFFRAGKQTINWGKGYYFSPADVVNLERVDPTDPDKELEGPVSAKLHYPVGVHNVYFYAVGNEAVQEPRDIAVAPKAEVLFGTIETTIGAFFQREKAPKGILMFSYPYSDFDFFGEGVISYGTDKTFVQEDTSLSAQPYGITTYSEEEKLFYQGTLGFRYSHSDYDIYIGGQYYYNGLGYDNSELLSNAMMLYGTDTGIEPALSSGDLAQWGKHYATADISYTGLFDGDITLSTQWLGNLSDSSGIVIPSVSYRFIDYASAKIGTQILYGEKEMEFTPAGKGLSATLSITLGSNSF